jgi:hypothetical protein
MRIIIKLIESNLIWLHKVQYQVVYYLPHDVCFKILLICEKNTHTTIFVFPAEFDT